MDRTELKNHVGLRLVKHILRADNQIFAVKEQGY